MPEIAATSPVTRNWMDPKPPTLVKKLLNVLWAPLKICSSFVLMRSMQLLLEGELRFLCSCSINSFSLCIMDMILLTFRTFMRSSRPPVLWMRFHSREDRYPVFSLPSVILRYASVSRTPKRSPRGTYPHPAPSHHHARPRRGVAVIVAVA